MPIRAYCTICSDFFDHSRDVAAIHCGHTFHYECLLQWFQTAPNKTCPQCRKQVSTRHIINKLFFDINEEEEGSAVDPESLQNEIGRMKSVLSSKERDWRDKQKVMDTFKDTMDIQKKDLDKVRRDIAQKEIIISALKKQMNFLETKRNDAENAKEELRRLRTKVKSYEGLHVLLEGQQAEVESMVTDMGIGQAAVEQLSIYCISLKKEYEKLKVKERSSNEMCEKLKKEVFASINKLQKASVEMNKTKDDMRSLQNDLAHADKEVSSLKKKVEILQRTLSTPTRTNEALSRLVFESPAPVELKHPRLHQPSHSEDIDLNMTYNISTPEELTKKQVSRVPSKKMRMDIAVPSSKREIDINTSTGSKAQDGDPFFPNSLLFRKKAFGSMLDPQSIKPGAMRSGYDGLGGRTKFFQPSPLSEIRPLMKAKRKKVTRPHPKMSSTAFTLDNYFD